MAGGLFHRGGRQRHRLLDHRHPVQFDDRAHGVQRLLPSNGSANHSLAAATVQPIDSTYLAPLKYVSAGTKTFDGGGYLAPI